MWLLFHGGPLDGERWDVGVGAWHRGFQYLEAPRLAVADDAERVEYVVHTYQPRLMSSGRYGPDPYPILIDEVVTYGWGPYPDYREWWEMFHEVH